MGYCTQEAKSTLLAQIATEVRRIANLEQMSHQYGVSTEDLASSGADPVSIAAAKRGLQSMRDELGRMKVRSCTTADVVDVGSVVTIEFDDGERDEMRLDGVNDGNPATVTVQSPLGAAINGHRVGDTVSYQTPNGQTHQATIIEIKAYEQALIAS